MIPAIVISSRVMSETRKPGPVRVKVNQRALVHKVLARYPGEFTVLRELLQNADDAEAKDAQIEFQTSDYGDHSAGANGHVNEINAAFPDLNSTKLSKWIVRNNGPCFRSEDWERLTTIADGNPDSRKIGAFGVGFYSVFGITDSPKVISGAKTLSMFFKDDEGHHLSQWTSIEMGLKEDMQGPPPKPFDLARFLVTTMTFMSCLNTISVLLDGNVILKICKSRDDPNIVYNGVPPNMKLLNEGQMMNIKSVSVATQHITVKIEDGALAAGTKRPSTPRTGRDIGPNTSKSPDGFWSTPDEQSEAQQITPPQLSTYLRTANYAVYSTEVTATPSKDLQKGLKAMMKKDTPTDFEFQMVYFSKEQHDLVAREEEKHPMGSVFRGLHGLFPQLDGDKYMSRVFIGQSTAQTSGIGGHLSGRFIPTVERGCIDLSNGPIATWNKALLCVGGFLARVVYETEIGRISNAWPKDEPMTGQALSRDNALHAMRYFSFHTSTPDAKVSNVLREAFFNCSRSDCFPILSQSGIHNTKDVRHYDERFVLFMTTPVLYPTKLGDPPSVIDKLPKRYEVPNYTFSDVEHELKGKVLQENQIVGFLQWWISAYDNQEPKLKDIRTELMSVAKLNIGNPKRELTLSNISKFVDTAVWLPALQPHDALPLDTIPFSLTRSLSGGISSALSWQKMTVVDWLCHLISEQVDSAHDIRHNETYSNRVLVILAEIWDTLSSEMQSKAKELMADISWIATNKGFRKSSGAYFDEVDIFDDLPVVTADLSEHGIRAVLSYFEVRNCLDFDELFSKAEQSESWSIEKMIKYLWEIRDRLKDIQSRAVFRCENGERSLITELYIPRKDIRQLGLPILRWPEATPVDVKMLIGLGFREHPSLEKIIEIAGSDNPDKRKVAFKYLSNNFDSLYEKHYEPSEFQDEKFIPVQDGTRCVEAHQNVYSDDSWAEMGFQIIHQSVDDRMRNRLKIRNDPSAEDVIDVFKKRQPKDHRAAVNWFECLATKQVLSPEHYQEIVEIPIIPIEDSTNHDIRMVTPRECFLGIREYPDDHHYRRIFTFVDFGERANNFLKACGVKTKPDCSDIVNMLLNDPSTFLEKTYMERSQDLENYLSELRSISIGYDRLSENQIERLKKAPIFVGYRRVSGPPNADPLESKLLLASEILITDDLGNRRIFEMDAWLAPSDETLEKLYKSMGSDYLANHIKYDVKFRVEPNEHTDPGCEEVRQMILTKLPIFLHELGQQRLKNHWEDNKLRVRRCQDFEVEKRLDFVHCISPEHSDRGVKPECPVSAEITTSGESVLTLWLADSNQVHMYDIAVALCRQLIQNPKKHDVLCLMTILKTDEEILRRRGYTVGGNDETQKPADQKDKTEKEPQEVMLSESPTDKQYGCRIPFRLKLPEFCRLPSSGVMTTTAVKGGDIDGLIDKTLEQLGKGKATFEEQEKWKRDYGGAAKKAMNVQYCDEQRCTNLDQVSPVDDAAGIVVWKQHTVEGDIPQEDLTKFEAVVNRLREVFELNDAKGAFNIFWHPDDYELMGFNRKGRIFLNLAHYISKHKHHHLPSGVVHIMWYHIIAHEIAHVKTHFHDEHHELLVSALIIRFFDSLHKVPAVRDYFGCSTTKG